LKDDQHDQKAEPKPGISRRKFLKGVGAGGGVLGTGLLTGPLLSEANAARQGPAGKSFGSAKRFGPDAVPIELTVNGQRRALKLEPRVTLLEALRDSLDLTGAKRVCDRTSCGACTVILDGSPVYSCSVLAIEAQGKAIQSVESLATGDTLHPVQAAFVENDAQQCGFCTPGFVMATKALLDKHPNPTPEQLRLGLGGNLCRCGTYAGIRRAVLQASQSTKGRSSQVHHSRQGGQHHA